MYYLFIVKMIWLTKKGDVADYNSCCGNADCSDKFLANCSAVCWPESPQRRLTRTTEL